MIKERFSCTRDGLTIRGYVYRENNKNMPAAILSHGFMGNHKMCKNYAKYFCKKGFAAFIFDFNGGGLGSKSDGKSEKQVVFVRAMPLTGRTHQIRVHLASRGLPVLGDSLYGKKDCSRLMLHAESLTFLHPVSGKQMTVKAPLPDGFAF